MDLLPYSRTLLRAALFGMTVVLSLSGCSSLFDDPDQLIQVAQRGPATVNPTAAAQAINDYRRSRGLSTVTIDPKLMAIARGHSQAMARANKMSHKVRGEPSFSRRLSKGNYDAAIAVENVAAGHRNFSEALKGWKASAGHRANLLKPGVTQMGIAVSYADNGKYGNFWTLVLAKPDDRRTATGGPDAGPYVAIAR